MIADSEVVYKPQIALLGLPEPHSKLPRKDISDFAQDRNPFTDSLVKVGCEYEFFYEPLQQEGERK